MKSLLLAVMLSLPGQVLAQDAGEARRVVIADPVEVVVPVVPMVVAPKPVPDLENPLMSLKGLYQAIKSGQGWVAAMLLLFGVVGLLRKYGLKVYNYLYKYSEGFLFYVNKPFWFLFKTKIGGWVLNWLTAVAGALGTSMAAGVAIDGKAWQVAIMASTGGTVLIELWKDIKEWWVERKAKKAVPPPVAPIPDPNKTPVA